MAKTILLADDSLTIQKVVELTFMDQDYQVTAVGDGQAALARWAESRPDLVIADVHMPGADGYEVCRQVKRSRPGTPVLLLVGTFETFDEAQAQSCGADGHLKKPFDSQELFRLVERLISENAARQAPAAPAFPAQAPAFPAQAPTFQAQAPADPFGSASVFGAPAPAYPAPAPAATPAPPAFAGPTPPAAAAAPEFAFGTTPVPAASAFDRAPAPEPVFAPPAAYAPAPEPVAAAPVPVAPPEAGPDPAPQPAAQQPAAVQAAAGSGELSLSDADVERIARRVVDLIGEKAVKEIAWEVVPDLAEVVIKERIRELESQVQ